MSARHALTLFCIAVLAAMLGVTTWASMDRNVLVAAGEIWQDPWGRATLFDAYFAFAFVWLWMAWRSRTWIGRVGWAVAVALLGNFAIAFYVLLALRKTRGQGLGALFERRSAEGAT